MPSSISNGHRALRKGKISLPGQTYFITVVCLRRQARFANFDTAYAVSRVLGCPAQWRGVSVLAWVLMPDHWHALITLGNTVELSRVMQRINSRTARAANLAIGG